MDFKRYLTEAAIAAEQPVTGDAFDISVNEMLNVECSVVDHGPGSVTIMLDERAISMLEHCGCQFTGESSADEPESDDIDQDDKRYDDAEDAEDDEKIEESSHVVKHATHGAVYAKDGKAKLFMTRREAEEVADAMASKHGGSGISVTQAPYTGYFVKMPETKIEEADYSETDSHGPYARGAADADYGRKYEPHKFVDNGKGGKIKEVLTDLGEIAQYKKGYTTGGVDKQDFSEQIAEKNMSEKALGINQPKVSATNEEADQIDEANSHRKVDDLKSKGKHHEAGVLAAKSSHDRQYGAHFGMRSGKEEAQRQFFKGYDSVKKTNEESDQIDENFGGQFKDSSEWENAAKKRGLVVKLSTHPSGEVIKYQIAKDKSGNNRGHFDHGTKSGRLTEEADIDEALGTIKNIKAASKFSSSNVSDMIRGEKARKAGMAKVSTTKDIGYKVVDVGPGQKETVRKMHNFKEAESGLSTKTLANYSIKASDAAKHRKLPTSKVDNRYAGVSRVDRILSLRDKKKVD